MKYHDQTQLILFEGLSPLGKTENYNVFKEFQIGYGSNTFYFDLFVINRLNPDPHFTLIEIKPEIKDAGKVLRQIKKYKSAINYNYSESRGRLLIILISKYFDPDMRKYFEYENIKCVSYNPNSLCLKNPHYLQEKVLSLK